MDKERAKEKTASLHWESVAIVICAIILWISGFDKRWFGFGFWTENFPDWYPPPQKEFLLGIILTGLGLAWSFASIRYAGLFNKLFGWLGFLYFYLHVMTLGYMADPSLFIWNIFRKILE